VRIPQLYYSFEALTIATIAERIAEDS